MSDGDTLAGLDSSGGADAPGGTGTYWESEVTGVGPDVAMMADEGVLIFFGDPAPPELAEVSVLHTPLHPPQRPIEVGDVVEGAGAPLTVTAVGSIADDNLRDLGHMVLYCDPGPEVQLLPGALHVTGRMALPAPGTAVRLRAARTHP